MLIVKKSSKKVWKILCKTLYFFSKIWYYNYIEKREVRKMSEDPQEKPNLKMDKNIISEDEEGRIFTHLLGY